MNEEIIALLQQYSKTVEELDFSLDGMSVEQVEEKLKELFSDNTDNSNNEDNENNKPEKFVKSFELSHEDIRYALYNLLSPVETEDNEWYFIDQVYDDKFEYLNWEGTKIYRQSYKKDGDNVTFEGERVQLFQERLTQEEKDALDKMRSNYSLLEQEVQTLREYQNEKFAEERKVAEDELFERYSEELGDNEEFKNLKEKSSKYTLEDLEKEIALIFVKTKLNFSLKSKSKDTVTVKVPINTNDDKVESPYGDLFDKYLKK